MIVPDSDDVFYHVGNLFIKRMYFEFDKGHKTAIGHSHAHDHVSLLAHGSVRINCDGEEREFHAPAFINVPAGVHHEFTALEDKTVMYCVHDTCGLAVDALGIPFKSED